MTFTVGRDSSTYRNRFAKCFCFPPKYRRGRRSRSRPQSVIPVLVLVLVFIAKGRHSKVKHTSEFNDTKMAACVYSQALVSDSPLDLCANRRSPFFLHPLPLAFFYLARLHFFFFRKFCIAIFYASWRCYVCRISKLGKKPVTPVCKKVMNLSRNVFLSCRLCHVSATFVSVQSY